MTRPIRVGIDALSENPERPSGALGYYINLVRELAALDGVEVVLFVGRRAVRYFAPAPSLTMSVLPWANEAQKRRIAEQHLLLPLLALRHRLDVLNTGNIAPLFVPVPLVTTNKTMHAHTVPETLPRGMRTYRQVLGPWSARRSRLIISNSDSNTEDIVRYLHVPRAKIRKVHEALDHAMFHPLQDEAATGALLARHDIRAPFVLFVSSLWPYKNADGLAAAFAAAGDRLADRQLVYAGFDRESETSTALRERLRALGLDGRVRFTGGLPQSEVALLYGAAEMLVYPSRYETFGLPLLEAMACGCPVVAADRTSLPEIAGGAALLVDPDDPASIAAAMARVAHEPGLRDDLVRRGLARAAEFSWRRTAEETLAVFREAAEGGGG